MRLITSIRFCICLVLFFACFAHKAYPQGWAWGRTTISPGTSEGGTVATDNSGNVYMGGQDFYSSLMDFGSGVTVPAGTFGFWVKYNSAGIPLWADGTPDADLSKITTDPAGNLIVCGTFSTPTMHIGSFTLINAYGGTATQYFIAKISPAGTVLWAIADGNVSAPFVPLPDATMDIATDAGGNIYITSFFRPATIRIGATTLTNTDPSGMSCDYFVAKYSPSGTALWAKSAGGSKNDYGFGITVSGTGNVYITGCFVSPSITVGLTTLTNSGTNNHAFIAEYSPAGIPLWAQAGGGTIGAIGAGITSDNNGNVYVTGSFGDNSITFGSTTVTRTAGPLGFDAVYILKYSSANTILWRNGISASQETFMYGITTASCGSVWVIASYDASAYIDTYTIPVPAGVVGVPILIAGYDQSSGNVIGYNVLADGGDDIISIAGNKAGDVYIGGDFYTAPLLPYMVVGPDTLRNSGSGEAFFLSKYTSVIPDTFYAAKDTALCALDSMLLKGDPGYLSYYWDNGSTDSARMVHANGDYFVYNVRCGDTVKIDTFHVTFSHPDTTHKRIDTFSCASAGSVTLSAPPGYTSYTWSNGAASASVSASATGTYYVNAIKLCGFVSDTFHLSILPNDTTFLDMDTTVCAYIGSLSLSAPPGYLSYLWNTGVTISSATVSGSGTYYVTGTNQCNFISDTFRVTFVASPEINLGNDTTICTGESITLSSVQPAGSIYMWSTGSTAKSITVSREGAYRLTVTSEPTGCVATDSIALQVMDKPTLHVGPDTLLCNGETVVITADNNAAVWFNGTTGGNITATEAGEYWATLTNKCAVVSDTATVKYEICNIVFPSAFTPNGDGNNELIRAIGTLGAFTNFTLGIYNRWGQRVFYTDDIYGGWNGIFNGAKQDVGTYFYLIKYSLHGKQHMMKGDFELIR